MAQLLGSDFASSLSSGSWLIQGSEKSKYESIFESLKPINGKLSGDTVRPVLLNSKLSVDVLGKVWELSDVDKDGFLDKEEFCVAMYLVYRAIEKEPVPSILPLNLVPPSKRSSTNTMSLTTSTATDRVLAGAVPVLPSIPSSPSTLTRHSSTSSSHAAFSPKHVVSSSQVHTPPQWLVSQADRARFNGIFQTNKDPDNFISGTAARNVFVQSGLSQTLLAHVWNMCDQQQTGKLSQDQFIIAMHLISQKVKGIELPTQITPEMLSANSHDSGFGDIGSLSDASSGIGDSAAVRELDALNQEIEELRREKESLTAEIQQKELSIKTTSLEVQELQDTLDKDSSSLAQLECDKAEAHTRLDELEQQRNKLDGMLTDVRRKVQEENETIKSLRAQISAQEASVDQQEVELRKVRNELSELQKEETQLEQRLEAGRQQQANVERSVKMTQQEIEKIQGQLGTLQQQRKSVSSNIEQYDKAVAAIKSESKEEMNFDLHASTSGSMGISGSVFSMGGLQERVEDIKNDLKEDPFKETHDPFKNADPFSESDPFGGSDPFATTATNSSDPFAGADPFPAPESSTNNDPFQTSDSSFGFPADQFPEAKTTEKSSDPFGGQDPFKSAGGSVFDSNEPSGFQSDPFAGSDIFATSTASSKPDPPTTASSETYGNSGAFGTSAFADAFSDSDASKGNSSLFADSDPFASSKESKSTTDPWGSAFGGGSTAGTGGDPFGGDPFASDPFGKPGFDSDPFAGFSSDASKKTTQSNKAPPRPVKPAEMSGGGFPVTEHKKKHHKHSKDKPAIPSEADQLAWAKEESKRAAEERRKKERQEQADLELAIALSKQQ